MVAYIFGSRTRLLVPNERVWRELGFLRGGGQKPRLGVVVVVLYLNSLCLTSLVSLESVPRTQRVDDNT